MARTKKEIEIPKCPICGGEMPYEPINCNFEHMIGRAGWHMSFNPRMNMCRECSKSLLDHVETWFTRRNKTNTYKKFSR